MNYEKYKLKFPAFQMLTSTYLLEEDYDEFIKAMKDDAYYAANVVSLFKPKDFANEFHELITLNEDLFNWIYVNVFYMENVGYLRNIIRISAITITILERAINQNT